MLVVDDTRINLLKMKEKLLKITKGDRQALLDEYKELTISIDKDEYDALVEKIKNSNYSELPLEEQVVFLNDILDNYNSLNELQCRYRDVYEEYTSDVLELSDLSNILVDNITERSNVIQGYLVNCKNLESNKIELDRLNLELIDALKKQILVDKYIKEINDDLKTNILLAEGRVQDHGKMVYTSTVQEFSDAGLDLHELVDNPDKLKEELSRVTKERDENAETLKAAMLCYNGSNRNEDIYDGIKSDVKKSEYVLVLLEIVNEICTVTKDYDLMLNKLNRLLNLIEERKLYLKKDFYIDPFDRIGISEHLKKLEEKDDNVQEIASIKRTINYFTDNISSVEDINNEYLNRITENKNILKEEEKPVENDSFIRLFDLYEANNDNKVIKVSNLNDGFKLDRALEKANSVIVRVNELFTVNKENIQKTPELVIENVQKDEQVPEDGMFIEEKDTNSIFKENLQNFSVQTVNEDDSVFEDDTNNIFVDEVNNNLEDDLFTEVRPFDEAPLFAERSDDIFDLNRQPTVNLNESVQNVEEHMPDAFWTTIEDTPKEEVEVNNVLSFDEQIDKLMNDNYSDKVKTR